VFISMIQTIVRSCKGTSRRRTSIEEGIDGYGTARNISHQDENDAETYRGTLDSQPSK
jgi:hypothetical protein